eukprot:749613-Hanusia_phi.AAC.4
MPSPGWGRRSPALPPAPSAFSSRCNFFTPWRSRKARKSVICTRRSKRRHEEEEEDGNEERIIRGGDRQAGGFPLRHPNPHRQTTNGKHGGRTVRGCRLPTGALAMPYMNFSLLFSSSSPSPSPAPSPSLPHPSLHAHCDKFGQRVGVERG